MNPPTGNPGDCAVSLLPACPADAGEIESMAREIWPAAYSGIISDAQIEFMLHWMYSPSKLIAEMAPGGVSYYWISSDDTKAGFIAAGLFVDREASYQIHKFYVLPSWQHRGIGSRAMELLIDRLKRSGADCLELRVNRSNTSAIAFYRKNDFEIYAADCRDIGGGFFMDDFLLRRIIPEDPAALHARETIR